MFDTRESASGKCAYLIHVERAQKRTSAAKYAARVVQVIRHSTAALVWEHPPVHEHFGEWPEEAIEKAFEEAERLVLRQPGTERVLGGRPHGTRD